MDSQQVIFNIVVNSKVAERRMEAFANTVDKQVNKIIKDFDRLEKSLKDITVKVAALNKEGLKGMISDIKRASSEVEKLEKKMKRASNAGQGSAMGGSRARRGGKSFGVGRIGASALGMVGGLAAYEGLQVVKNMYSTGQEFEYVMTQVKGITGSTVDEFKSLTSAVEEFSSKSSFGLKDFAEASKFLAMSGADSGTIKNMLPSIGSLAMATGNNMGTTADWLTNISNQYGISSKDSMKLSDVMTATMTNSNVAMNEYAKSLEYVGTIAAQSGVHVNDLSAMVGVLGDLGLKGSKSGTGLRSLLLALSSPNSKQSKLMSKYGIQSTRQTKDGRTVLNDPEELFKAMGKMSNTDLRSFVGKTGLPAALGLITKSKDGSLSSLTGKIDSGYGKTKQLEDEMKNTSFGAMQHLSSSWENLSNKLFGTDGVGAGSVGTRLMNGLADAINLLADSDGLKNTMNFMAKVFGFIYDVAVKLKPIFVFMYDIASKLLSFYVAIYSKIFNFISLVDDKIKSLTGRGVGGWIEKFTSNITTAFSKVTSDIRGFFEKMSEPLDTVLSKVQSITMDVRTAFAQMMALTGDNSYLEQVKRDKLKLESQSDVGNKVPWYVSHGGATEGVAVNNTVGKAIQMGKDFMGIVDKFTKYSKDNSGRLKVRKSNIIANPEEIAAETDMSSVSPLTSQANEMSRSIIVNIHDGLLHVDNQNVGVGADGTLDVGDMEQQISEVLTKVVSDFELSMSR